MSAPVNSRSAASAQAPRGPRPSAESFARASEAVAGLVKRPAAAPAPRKAADPDKAARADLERARQRWQQSAQARGFAEDKPAAPQGELLPKPARTAPKRPAKAPKAGNVTPAIPPAPAKNNRSDLRLAAVAVAASDSRLRLTTRVILTSLAWRYWPGRPWRGDIAELGALSGLSRTPAYRAIREAVQVGHLWTEGGGIQGLRIGGLWWPAVERAAATGWTPPEQYELPLDACLDREAAAYLTANDNG